MNFFQHHVPPRGTSSRWSIRGAACAILLAFCSPFAALAQSPNLLFSSGFEPNTTLGVPTQCFGTGCWQVITGTDASTGYTWPPNFWGGTTTAFQLLADKQGVDATTIHDYMFNEIRSVTGHNGTPTQVLYSQVSQSGCCGVNPQGGGATQNAFQIQPTSEGGDLYISYWLMFQPDLDHYFPTRIGAIYSRGKPGLLVDSMMGTIVSSST